MLSALALTNADISGSAAIAYSKLNLATSIVNADVSGSAAITESKILFSTSGHGHTGGSDGKLITINRAFPFFIAGSPSVANDQSWNPTAPQAMTAVKIWAYARTAPTGTAVILRIFNVTQGAAVGSVTIATSATSGTSTSFTTPAIAAGNVLRIDCTQADSNVVGANFSVVLESTQP